MSEVVRVGSIFDHTRFHDVEGVRSSSRNVAQIEKDLWKVDFNFSFSSYLRELALEFGDKPIKIFDSGCGYGNAAGDFKKILETEGVEVVTAGITMSPFHIYRATRENRIDKLFVGSVEKFAQQAPQEEFHFILDFHGPTRYCVGTNVLQEGAVTFPLYSSMLKKGGSALIVCPNVRELDEPIDYLSKGIAQNTLRLLDKSGFDMIRRAKDIALVVKR
ncbi:hypothetical protein KKG52_02585 [Patescibacteria group bacterium]|nr:hypothetical protein [Patescibacteria group bacterium]